MNKDDVMHLARLARIAVTDQEAEQFTGEIDAILDYVGVVSEVAADEVAPVVGSVHNVFRADEVTNEPGKHSAALLAELPEREGQFMKVKKILNADD